MYATAMQYRNSIGMTDTAKDIEIEADLSAVSRYIDGKMGRFFSKDTVAVSRIYLPERTATFLLVDDIAETPTSIEVDTENDGQYTTELTTDDYELMPFNATRGPEPWPYTMINLTPWGDLSAFHAGQRVRITAIFGWPEVPEAIKIATIHLTAVLRLETPRATRRIAELGDVMETSPIAQGIVRQLTEQYKVWRL